MRKEKEQLLVKLKAGFEATLGTELLEVFGKAWEGQKRREIARGLEVGVERVKASRAQLFYGGVAIASLVLVVFMPSIALLNVAHNFIN